MHGFINVSLERKIRITNRQKWGEAMTIEEMRSIMLRKVVPEEVVPQNVINCLIDEDAEPPKLDAFTFLMRLRALGIGSDDFLNLLEGCGAPKSVVNKISQNPAMNLQGLILTLENSGLTSDDYTRMLLTARQVWERTLTLRLEKSEKISREIEQETESDSDEEGVKEYGEPSDVGFEPQEEAETEYIEDGGNDEEYDANYDDYDEDMREMSFTAVFDKINTEMREGTFPKPEILSDAEPQSADDEEISKENTEAPAETYYSADEPVTDNAEEIGGDTELSFAEAFDKIKNEKQNEPTNKDLTAETSIAPDISERPETDRGSTFEISAGLTGKTVGDTTTLIQIDEEMLRENFGKFSLQSESSDENEPKGTSEKLLKTARQQKSRSVEEDEPESSEEYEETAEEYDESAGNEPGENGENYKDDEEDENDGYNESSESERRAYHKGAIIGAAVGAAALVGAGFFIGEFLSGKDAKNLHYAADNYEIFDKIRYAYNDSFPGGSAASDIGEDHHTIFGDLLISGDNDKKELCSFLIGTGSYSITEEAISASIVENGTVIPLDDLIPPENSHFVAAFDDNGELYAIFSGKQSGYMKIADGKAEYTVRQDGILTDYELSDGEMRLGTVYTPVFGHTFNINNEDMYLPKIGTDAPEPIPPQKVIITDAKGYSYGVSAEYSTENGSVNDACAIIGDPVTASADGRFALNENNGDTGDTVDNGSNKDKGLLVKANGDKLDAKQTETLLHAAFGKNGCAVIEKTDENISGNVKLLDNNFKSASVLTGITEKISGMWFDGEFLTINGSTDSVFVVDCTKLSAPEPLKLRSADGIVSGSSALICEVTDASFVITRYDLKEGKAEKAGEYSKELTADQLKTVKRGAQNTAVIDGSKSGMAYSYFDGVSVISEYVVFDGGSQPEVVSVFDDKTGFTAAFKDGNAIKAVCAEGVKVLQ